MPEFGCALDSTVMFFPPNVISLLCFTCISMSLYIYIHVFLFCFVVMLAAYCVVSVSPFFSFHFHCTLLFFHLIFWTCSHNFWNSLFIIHPITFFSLKCAPTMGTGPNVHFGTILWLIEGPIYPFSDFYFSLWTCGAVLHYYPKKPL